MYWKQRKRVPCNGGWYIDKDVNWEAIWVNGAWMKWTDGTHSRIVHINEHPLCRNGNNGTHNGKHNPYQCDPHW